MKLFEKKKDEEIEKTSEELNEDVEVVDEETEKKPRIPKTAKVIGGTALGLLAVFGLSKLFGRGSGASDWDFSDDDGAGESSDGDTETTPADSDEGSTTAE